MTFVALETPALQSNPLDLVEDAAAEREWYCERINDTDVVIEVTGRWCSHHLSIVWHPEMHSLHLTCQYDIKVPANRRRSVNDLLAEINSKLWLGHFDLDVAEMTPSFRHGLLLRGTEGLTSEQINDLLDIAMAECDRFYPAFQFVIWGGKPAVEAIGAAILETVGEA